MLWLKKIYFIFDEQTLPTLWDEYIRREVQRGIEQLDCSEGQPLDIVASTVEARRHHVALDQQCRASTVHRRPRKT